MHPALYAGLVGKAYGISGESLEKLRLAAILHDTGKISLAQTILEKDGPFYPRRNGWR